jgi:hypothetical protein
VAVQINLLTFSNLKQLFISCLNAIFLSRRESNCTAVYSVSFYDENLDFIETAQISGDNINLSNIKSGLWYKAGEDLPLMAHNLNGDIRLYAVENVIEITKQHQLNNVRNALDGKYIILNDILLDEEGAGFEGSNGWKPIGDPFSPFTGTFNGNSCSITNLWINRPSDDYIGLFGGIENAKIKNLGVEIAEGKDIKGNFEVGGIAGYINNGAIINSCLNGNINGSYDVGGIAGMAYGDSCIINSCSDGNINGDFDVGGIVGFIYSKSRIVNSCSSGNVSGCDKVGGIAGYIGNGVSITNSCSTANVNGSGKYIGGIAGNIKNGSIVNSYSSGNVSGCEYVGGIAGRVECVVTIKNNAALNPSVAGTNCCNINRIAGYVEDNSTISNNLARSALPILGFSNFCDGNANSGIGKTDDELHKKDTYETTLSWRFGDNNDEPWIFDDCSYPMLYWQNVQ